MSEKAMDSRFRGNDAGGASCGDRDGNAAAGRGCGDGGAGVGRGRGDGDVGAGRGCGNGDRGNSSAGAGRGWGATVRRWAVRVGVLVGLATASALLPARASVANAPGANL